MSKKKLIVIGVVVAALLVVWLSGLWRTIYKNINPTTVYLTVADSVSKDPIEGATVWIGSANAKTDSSGTVVISGLAAGNAHILVTKLGYNDYDYSVKLYGGENKLEPIFLKKLPIMSQVSLKIQNKISKEAIPQADITYNGQSLASDPSGILELTNLENNSITVSVKKDGFYSKQSTINLATQTKGKPIEINLTPNGSVIFSSNRTGKAGLYICGLDGSGTTPILVPTKGTIGSTYPSPDMKRVAFYSTHQGIKAKTGNGFDTYLYIGSPDGTIKKVVKGEPDSVSWLPDGSGFVYKTYNYSSTAEGDSKNTLYFYNVNSGVNTKIVEVAPYIGDYLITSNSTIYYSVSSTEAKKMGLFAYNLNTGKTQTKNSKATANISWDKYGKSILIYVESVADQSKKYSYNLSTGKMVETDTSDSQTSSFSFSSDMKKIAFIEERDGKSDVYIKDVNSSTPKKITSLGYVYGSLYWLDDKYIVFSVSKTGENAKYITDINGTTSQKITDETRDQSYGR